MSASLPPTGASGDAGVNPAGAPDPALERVRQAVIHNTRAALTTLPEQKEQWWATLGEWHARLQPQSPELAAFIDLVRRLLEGADPHLLTPQVPGEFEQAWQSILACLPEK